jgi:poly-gamma-glutamate capsule biosynthesis protein CapA/YwtB (metallophosphatase superfamily)
VRLALAGDTMLGRGVADRLREVSSDSLVAPAVVDVFREADLALLNLECCISERGERWPARGKEFFFRAPPSAVELLQHLGVDCVNLANNHALDFGRDALLDTFSHLEAAGIEWVGAGPDLERARAPAVLEADGHRLAVFGASDHPRDFAAAPDLPGIAHVELAAPTWLLDGVSSVRANAVLATPHWGPNMVAAPLPAVRRAATQLIRAGATLVAGHSAHVFHGVEGAVLYDLGDFLDDYRRDTVLRNDLGLLWLVDLAAAEDSRLRPARIEAVPLALEYAHTRLAEGPAAEWVARRLETACAELGTEVEARDGRLVIEL